MAKGGGNGMEGSGDVIPASAEVSAEAEMILIAGTAKPRCLWGGAVRPRWLEGYFPTLPCRVIETASQLSLRPIVKLHICQIGLSNSRPADGEVV
jgi:hypothetical protein